MTILTKTILKSRKPKLLLYTLMCYILNAKISVLDTYIMYIARFCINLNILHNPMYYTVHNYNSNKLSTKN